MNPLDYMLSVHTVMELARKYLGAGTMESSARLCLKDACHLWNRGEYMDARSRAVDSLRYSVGILHVDYRAACAQREGLVSP